MNDTSPSENTPPGRTGGLPERDPRVYMAVERTFLAWIRTGLAMMGFGFVVARFGMFLLELAAAHPAQTDDTPKLSLWFGTALVIIGAFVNLVSAIQHVRIMRELRSGDARFGQPSVMGVVVAISLALLGAAMVSYLVIGLAPT